jgi:hypothetical protein
MHMARNLHGDERMKYIWRECCSKCDMQLTHVVANRWICGCDENE